jgi:hypothetical protein
MRLSRPKRERTGCAKSYLKKRGGCKRQRPMPSEHDLWQRNHKEVRKWITETRKTLLFKVAQQKIHHRQSRWRHHRCRVITKTSLSGRVYPTTPTSATMTTETMLQKKYPHAGMALSEYLHLREELTRSKRNRATISSAEAGVRGAIGVDTHMRFLGFLGQAINPGLILLQSVLSGGDCFRWFVFSPL